MDVNAISQNKIYGHNIFNRLTFAHIYSQFLHIFNIFFLLQILCNEQTDYIRMNNFEWSILI